MPTFTSDEELDKLIRTTTPHGSTVQSLTNALYGLNMNIGPNKTDLNRDVFGYTFFTRPQLNLSSDNITNSRKLATLLTESSDNIYRYIRKLLDPRLEFGDIDTSGDSVNGLKSSLVDPFNPFLPVLTNTLESISGWPDIVAPTYTSKDGVRREQWSIVDGFVEIFNAFDLDLNFKNIREEPLTLLFQMWTQYQASVYDGTLVPYPDMVIRREIDYQTRIYRLIMGEGTNKIKKIAATGASFPISVPMGKFFDGSQDSNLRTQSKNINIRFKCQGAMYNDIILMQEFNEAVAAFNPDIRAMLDKDNETAESNLILVPDELKNMLNHRAIPFIDLRDNTLQWYINKNLLEVVKLELEKTEG